MALFSWLFLLLTIANGQVYLHQPKKITSDANSNIILEVRSHIANITNASSGQTIATVKIRAFCLQDKDCEYIGPTIYAKPGQLVTVTLNNTLKGVGRYGAIFTDELPPEGYKDPDVVNLHVHGLHVSPSIDNIRRWTSPLCSDEIMSKNTQNNLMNYDCIYPGMLGEETQQTLTYPYQIPRDHYPGTHWYHAHWHGSTSFQVQQGLMGMIIIEDESHKPDMEEVILVSSFVWLHNSSVCKELWDCGPKTDNSNLKLSSPENGGNYPFNFPIQSACFLYCKMGSELPFLGKKIPVPWNSTDVNDQKSQYELSETQYEVIMDESIDAGEKGIDFFFVNGQIYPTLNVSTSKWYHLRMVNTFMAYLFWYYPLELEDICQVYVMGQDGIYFENGPRDLLSDDSKYLNNTVILPPGARADIAIQCEYFNLSDNNINPFYEKYGAVIPIFALTSTNPKYPHLGYAPTLREEKLFMKIEIVDNGLISSANITDVFTPQPYDGTLYLNTTLNKNKDEITSFCSRATREFFVGYDSDEMSMCNIVLGRQKYVQTAPINLVAINNIQFNGNLDLSQICVGDSVIREWTVTANYHPFHHHTWPYQLQHDITHGWMAQRGDWRDTVGASGTFRIRSNYVTSDNISIGVGVEGAATVITSLISHCHYVPHEDHGLMAGFHMVGYDEIAGNCSIDGEYIVANISTEKSLTPNRTRPCLCGEKHAKTNIYMEDINTNLNITVNRDCFGVATFSFQLSPRTITVGNLWLGFGFHEDYKDIITRNDIKNASNDCFTEDNQTFCYNDFPMKGKGFAISIQATEQGPLTGIGVTDIILDEFYASSTASTYRYFDCGENTIHKDGYIYFECIKYVNGLDGSDEDFNFGESQTFIWAYGEGRFRMERSYHSSRSGCRFQFHNELNYDSDGIADINCVHSQNQVRFDINPTQQPTTSPTTPPTSAPNIVIFPEPVTTDIDVTQDLSTVATSNTALYTTMDADIANYYSVIQSIVGLLFQIVIFV